MREIVLDTETTGFHPEGGDRIVEIGAIELMNHVATGERFHEYINPLRSMPAEAFAVHGLGDEFLAKKPTFDKVAQKFLDFVGDSKMIIHNAPFDMKFLNSELSWLNLRQLPMEQAVDTLAMARSRFPGANNTLDALCRRFNIDNTARTLHGALLDSEILAEVYLEMIGGRQPDLVLGSQSKTTGPVDSDWRPQPRTVKLASRLTDKERKAHAEFVENMGADALWAQPKP
jgi:DNA polymerase-3 subunit epsilon